MTADMFTQMRGVLTLQRMVANDLALQGEDYPKLMSVWDALRLATIGGAKGLKIDARPVRSPLARTPISSCSTRQRSTSLRSITRPGPSSR